jgi:hypothetical protein
VRRGGRAPTTRSIKHQPPSPPPHPHQSLFFTNTPFVDRPLSILMLRALPTAAERFEHFGHREEAELRQLVADLAEHAGT